MFYFRRMQLVVCAVAILLFPACGDDTGSGAANDSTGNNATSNASNNTGGNGGTLADSMTISGTIDEFNDDAMDISITHGFDDLGWGSIEQDGSFSFELFSLSEVVEDLDDVLTQGDVFLRCPINEDDFSATDLRWRTVNSHINTQSEVYPVHEHEDGVWTPEMVLRLAEYHEGDDVLDFPSDNVFWVYVDRDVAIDAEDCEMGSHERVSLDLNLQAGWNEIVMAHTGDPVDPDDIQHFHHAIADRPANAVWHLRDDVH